MKKLFFLLTFCEMSRSLFTQSTFNEKTFNDLMAPVRNSALQVLLVLTLILGFYTEGVAQCTCTNCRCNDSLELVKLYNATGGANWTRKWILTHPMTTWSGVFLTDGRVTTVDVSSNNLMGTIPNLKLTKLEYLYINFNYNLSGPIPNFDLPKLQVLDLAGNLSLSGPIPNFNLLPKLHTLFLSDNSLSGTIPNFNSLPKLQTLYLWNNQLTGTIPNFNLLPKLQSLVLSGNQLSGTIPNFDLPKLQYLDLSFNPLSGTIPNFKLKKLQALFFFANELSGPIPNFELPNLQTLQLDFNQLSGTIPNFKLSQLTFISVSSNQLSGQIPNFNLPNLQTLLLNDNQLSGCIANEIKANCPSIGPFGGDVSNNPNLATQTWANYWNNGEGACSPISIALRAAVRSATTTTDWRIYPNPTHDVLNIEGLTEMSKVTIYNVAGGLVFNTQVKDNAIDVSQLSRGMYTIRIISGQNNAAHLFLKE